MSQIAEASPVATAVLDALEATGRPVGDGVKPATAEPPPADAFPYLVARTTIVYTAGSIEAPKESALHRVELTAVGLTTDGVRALLDDARHLVLDPALPIDGHSVVWREDAGGQPPRPDQPDDIKPPRFFAVAVVNLFVSPA